MLKMEEQFEFLLCHLSTSHVIIASHGHITNSLSFIICKMRVIPIIDMCSVKVCSFMQQDLMKDIKIIHYNRIIEDFLIYLLTFYMHLFIQVHNLIFLCIIT